MKKKNFYLRSLLMGLLSLAIYSCGNNATKESSAASGISKEDSIKIATYDLFFGMSKLIEVDNSGPVKDEFVAECVTTYKRHFKDTPTMENMKKAYTTYASFGSSTLADWVVDMKENTNTTDFRLYLGVYSKKAGDILSDPKDSVDPEDIDGVKENEGRLTIIIRPYHDNKQATYNNGALRGAVVKSYNLGQLHP